MNVSLTSPAGDSVPIGASQDWQSLQLGVLISSLSNADARKLDQVASRSLELISRSVDAEISIFLHEDAPIATLGLGGLKALPIIVASNDPDTDLPGLGRCRRLSIALPGFAASRMLFVRTGSDPFSSAERSLLYAASNVVAMAIRAANALDAERSERDRATVAVEQQMTLVAELKEQRDLLERLSRLQRAIATRAPLQTILHTIVDGARELASDDFATLQLVDPHDARFLKLVAEVGLRDEFLQASSQIQVGQGVNGEVLRTCQLIVVNDYHNYPNALPSYREGGLRTVMSAPVFDGSRVIGTLTVGSFHRCGPYADAEVRALLAFSDSVSLSLSAGQMLEELHRSFERALHQSMHDPLTGLANRRLFVDSASKAIANPSGAFDRVAVVFIDLDDFKLINDSLGHEIGDRVLAITGQRLANLVQHPNVIARLGGDEFAVLCPTDAHGANLERLVADIQRSISQPVAIDGNSVLVDASIGIVVSEPGDQCSADSLLRDADIAMYHAKNEGKGQSAYFSSPLRNELLARVTMSNRLRTALASDQLHLVYQPVVDVRSGRPVSVEVLCRWDDAELGTIPPSEFVQVAEETGLINDLGRWVLDRACAEYSTWPTAMQERICFAVNVSGRQLSSPSLVTDVASSLSKWNVRADRLSLELTETYLSNRAPSMINRLHELKRFGVRLSLDDFGTGYASIGLLRQLPLDCCKIDRALVETLDNDPESRRLLRAVIDLARSLGFITIVEGVETRVQRIAVAESGGQLAQGYLFARPMTSDHCLAWLEAAFAAAVLPTGKAGAHPMVANHLGVLSAV